MPGCPHDRTSPTPDGLVCRACGAVLAREAPPPPLHWRPLAAGWVIAGVLLAWVPLAGFILHYLSILVHELGHAAVAWSVGIPAIPKFNLQQGGGITTHGCRMGLLVILLLAAGAWLIASAWPRGLRWRCAAIALVAIPLLLGLSGLDEGAITAAGHLAEVAMACVFLVRAATGMAVAHRAEQWLYAICGWAMWWIVLGFAWDLATSAEARAAYGESPSGIDNDLVRLADGLGGSVALWAWLLLFLAIAAPVIALWQARRIGGRRV